MKLESTQTRSAGRRYYDRKEKRMSAQLAKSPKKFTGDMETCLSCSQGRTSLPRVTVGRLIHVMPSRLGKKSPLELAFTPRAR